MTALSSRTALKEKPVFSYPDAAKALKTSLLKPVSVPLDGACIDTRKIVSGNIFIAIRGQKQDGHDYLEQCFELGASGAIISEEWIKAHPAVLENSKVKNLLPVKDTAAALVDLAKAYRSTFQIKAFGVTGSIGKTSTKEFLAYLLSQKFSVLSTAGNFNNHLGLPLTIMRLKPEHQVCVAELGANHVGEIEFLCKILKPDAAILTCVAPVHLEGFGSLENIYKAKGEILEALRPGSYAVVPDEDPLISFQAERLKLETILAGSSLRAHYKITEVSAKNGRVYFQINKKYRFSFPGSGTFLAHNAAMAVALADSTGSLKMSEMPADWQLQMPSGRFEEHKVGPFTFIFDGYNANPAAFDASLDCFASLKKDGKKWVAFADMGELGPEEKTFHERLGQKIASNGFNSVCYGRLSKSSFDAIRTEGKNIVSGHFDDAEQAAKFLEVNIQAGDAVLLKASRGMRVEQILQFFQKKYETASAGK